MNEPNQPEAIAGTVQWLVDLATGELALVVTTIAVAIVGLMMLDGRLDWRRGARVLLGCFLIFGAGTISSAFMMFGDGVTAAPVQYPSAAPQPSSQSGESNDPWASAFLKPDAPVPTSGRP